MAYTRKRASDATMNATLADALRQSMLAETRSMTNLRSAYTEPNAYGGQIGGVSLGDINKLSAEMELARRLETRT